MILVAAALLACHRGALPRTLDGAGSYEGNDYRMCSGVKSTALLV